MYERFTDRARKVMVLANQQAHRFSHEYIGTEHMLLALVKEGSGVAANVFRILNVELRSVRIEIEKQILSGSELVTMGKLPRTPEAKQLIEDAMSHARAMNDGHVGTEHLLLAATQAKGIAGDVLTKLNVSSEAVKQTILEISRRDDQPDRQTDPAVKYNWYDRRWVRVRAGKQLIEQAELGLLPPSCGPWQLPMLQTVLKRTWRNSALLVGEPGVGKRALVEKVATKIAAGDRSFEQNGGIEILEIKPAHCASAIEKTLTKNADSRRLFFIEDISNFLEPVVGDHGLRPFSAWLLSALQRGARCIATVCASDEKLFRAHKELAACFERIELCAAERPQVMEIVKSREEEYAHNHKVRLTEDAIQEAFELAQVYGQLLYPLHAQPALTLDVIEHAAAFESSGNSRADSDKATPGELYDLTSRDIMRSVAMRIDRDIEDVKNRNATS